MNKGGIIIWTQHPRATETKKCKEPGIEAAGRCSQGSAGADGELGVQ